MGTMREALLKAGLISHARHDQLEKSADDELRRNSRKAVRQILKHPEPTLDNLETCGSVNDFRVVALQILLVTPERISEILGLAHNLKDADGRKRLIWQLFQVRDGLKGLDQEAQRVFLKRSLRRAGGLGSKNQHDR